MSGEAGQYGAASQGNLGFGILSRALSCLYTFALIIIRFVFLDKLLQNRGIMLGRSKKSKVPKHREETVLITGATTGIGYEFAKLFASKGYDLVIVGRDRVKLPKIAAGLERHYKVSVRSIRKDLTTPRAADEIYSELRIAKVQVDILINNAGVGMYGEFYQMSAVQTLKLLQLNVVALTYLTRLFMPPMLKRRSGRVLNVASTASFLPGPLMTTYYASKHYVRAFSEGLSEEVRGSGVTVSALCPGPTKSNFWKAAEAAKSPMAVGRLASASSVARLGYRGLMRGKRVIVPGWRNKLVLLAGRLLPTGLVVRAVKRYQEGKGY